MRRSWLMWVLAALIPAAAFADVLFQDDFTGGKSPRWIQSNDGPGRGTFHVQNGAYVLASPDPVTDLPRAVVATVVSQDYFVQADVRIRPLAAAVSTASILSYYTDSRHFYEFAVDGRSQYWSLRKVDKSGSSLLAQGTVPGSPRLLFRMGLYSREGDLRVFIDGVMVAEEFDGRALAGGAFGLSAQGAEARWDHVVVRSSNPLDFFYAIRAQTTDASGKTVFASTRIFAIDESGKPLPSITIYRIRRDGLSYFVCQDPAAKYAPRSGFLREFERVSDKEYRVRLKALGSNSVTAHVYQAYEVEWLQDFLRRSARMSLDHVTADLHSIRGIHLRNGAFVQSGNLPIVDSDVAAAGSPAELNQMIFGKWEAFGNYSRFPSMTGRAGDGDQLISRAAAAAQVPQNSLFTLHVLRLAAAGPAVSLAWFVQEDSRAFILVDSAALPSDLQRGRSIDVPFTLLNTGENAGAFQLSVVLSRNSFPGATDIRLGRRSFSSLAGGGRIQSTMTIQLPSDVPDGRYFIATFLEVPTIRDKLLRVHNGNFVRPVQLGSFPAPGRLTVSLNWNGTADLDLHVTDPMGETLYYFRPTSASGGSISRDRECAGQTGQSEVVSYPAGQAVSGKYQISVHYFRACGAAKDVAYTVSVESDAGTQTFNGLVHPGDYARVADYVK